MVKKAAVARASSGRSRFVAVLAGIGRWTLRGIVLGLAIIGLLHLTRGTAVRHVRGVAADSAAVGVASRASR